MQVLISILKLVGGLAFFLYGMDVMSGGLSKVAGGSLERSLKKMTSNRFKGMIVGGVITIAIQSSSAMTVMLVGLVNSGIMSLGQTIGVIMGSNIGTTLTPWILSLSGVEGDGWIALLKPENFSLAFALLGILMIMMSKKRKRQDMGKILVGFAVLMYGMKLMGESVENLDRDALANIMGTFASNPVLGVVVGAVITGIIQSSAASVGMLQTLAMGGGISYRAAIPIIMGQNIGTCVTALISSIGVSKNAKKVSVVHITFNLIGTVACLILFYVADAIFNFAFVDTDIDAFGISVVHTIFNVSTTAMLCPFVKQLEAFANFVVRPAKKKEQYAFLDERLLAQPAMAVNEAANMTHKMARLAQDTISGAIKLCSNYSEKEAEAILKMETELDDYEDKLGTFLVQLSGRSLTDVDGRRVSTMLHTIGDLERLGDHAVNLVHSAEEIHTKKITFSEHAQAEITNLSNALIEILSLTIDSFEAGDIVAAHEVEPLEQVIDSLIAASKTSHIERLQAGRCTIQTGFVLSDILNNYSRVSDHCSNIAVALIETTQGSFETHEYLNEVKTGSSQSFQERYQHYLEKYPFPAR